MMQGTPTDLGKKHQTERAWSLEGLAAARIKNKARGDAAERPEARKKKRAMSRQDFKGGDLQTLVTPKTTRSKNEGGRGGGKINAARCEKRGKISESKKEWDVTEAEWRP